MKVLFRGAVKTTVWRGNCHRCSSILQATKDEVTIVNNARDQTSCGQAKCPVCGNDPVNFYPHEITETEEEEKTKPKSKRCPKCNKELKYFWVTDADGGGMEEEPHYCD